MEQRAWVVTCGFVNCSLYVISSILHSASSKALACLNAADATAGELSFEQVAKALHKASTASFGQGNTVGYATKDDSGHLEPFAFDRRELGEEDIAIQIAYAGICHSDLHQIKNEWGNSKFPMVPGYASAAALHLGWLASYGVLHAD